MRNPIGIAQLGAEAVLLVVTLMAATLRGLTLNKAVDPYHLESAEGAIDIVLALTAVVLLWRTGRLSQFAQLLAASWPLAPVIIVAVASLTWSIDAAASLARAAILVGSTALAAYLAVRYTMRDVVELFAWFFAVVGTLSLAAGAALPGIGTMDVPPYDGAWNGIFWHRNYLGSIMAMGSVMLLIAALLSWSVNRKRAVVFGGCYAIALGLVWLSRSATGMILALLLHGCLLAVAAWSRWRGRMRTAQYWAIGTLILIMVALVITKLDVFLGFFNRNSTFTGRVELWQYLWENIGVRRPVLGHGLGTLWTSPEFQRSVRDAVGWQYPVYIGDNGFIDVLLQLGIVGVSALLVALVWAGHVALRVLWQNGDLLSSVPLIVTTYLLVTNCTLSFFLETESVAWLVFFALVLSAVARLDTYRKARKIPTSSVE